MRGRRHPFSPVALKRLEKIFDSGPPPRRDEVIAIQYFGLYGRQPMAVADIAKEHNLSRGTVFRIIKAVCEWCGVDPRYNS